MRSNTVVLLSGSQPSGHTHALALRVLMEMQPDHPRRHGLVQWLYLNKKLDHWKSTRATAEVMYALARYVEHEGTLASREEIQVTVGPLTETLEFDPEAHAGGPNPLRSRCTLPSSWPIPPAIGSKSTARSSRGAFASCSLDDRFKVESARE